MNRVVRPSTQVIEFAKRLGPESRRAIKHALGELRSERWDIRALEANLSVYYLLRVGRHRIIFSYAADWAIEAIFLEDRFVATKVGILSTFQKLSAACRGAALAAFAKGKRPDAQKPADSVSQLLADRSSPTLSFCSILRAPDAHRRSLIGLDDRRGAPVMR